MVDSSFSPAPGSEPRDGVKEQARPRWFRGNHAVVREHSAGFSQYVSRRTILAGGCPAGSDGVVPRRRRRSVPYVEK